MTSTQRAAATRQTRDRVKSMITGHLLTFSELRFTDWCKLNRVKPTTCLDAMTELIAERKAKRGGFYQVPGLHGWESFQIFIAGDALLVEAPALVTPEPSTEVHPNVRMCEMAATWGATA